MEFQGSIVRIEATEQVSEKFKKRIFTLTDGAASYPNTIQFELHQDRTDLISPFKIGDTVNVKFNLKGRDWTDPKTNTVKTFNTLQAWAITKVAGEVFAGESLVPDTNSDLGF